MESGLHPCARCAQMQRTCCQTTEILLTAGDVARISAHAGREDFEERRTPSDPTYLEHDPADPEWLSLTVGRDGRRRMLHKREGAECTFLGAAGCVLPAEVRPLVCRLYPWSYTQSGLIGEDSSYCPSVLRRFVGDTMLEVLEMRRADAERRRAQLYAELGDERGSFGGVA